MEIRLQPLARRKAASLGDAGADWVERLPSTLAELAERWSLSWGRALPGGSASYVRAARTRDGEELVVKLTMPGQPATEEAAVLRAAQGRGYARLHARSPEHGALLMERLGRSRQQSPGSPEPTLDLLVDTLRTAWEVPVDLPAHDRVGTLLGLIRRLDDHHEACTPPLRRQVEAYAAALTDPGPDADVVCHGDPHPANLLGREGGGWAFVDPDGLRCDPAYDLGVTLREWHAHLEREGRPVLERWTDRVAERSGVDRDRIWRWAFLERVSTGLYVLDFGAERLGRQFLRTAGLLVD